MKPTTVTNIFLYIIISILLLSFINSCYMQDNLMKIQSDVGYIKDDVREIRFK